MQVQRSRALFFFLFLLAFTGGRSISAQIGSGPSIGPFHISGINNPNTCLAVSGGSLNRGTLLDMESCNSNANQSWTLIPVQEQSGTVYQMVAGNTGYCADVAGVSVQDGALVGQWPCLGQYQLNQLWQLTPYGNTYQIQSVNSSKCIDGGLESPGTTLHQFTCFYGYDSNQLLTLTPVTTASYDPTSTSIQASPTSTRSGATITMSATVTGALGNVSSGSITFMDGSTVLGTASVDGAGNATYSTLSLTAGVHALTAVYSGNSTFESSTSSNANVTITAEQASQSDAFVDSVGFATHLSYLNTPYFQQWPFILAELKKSGVRHIRDGYSNWPSWSPIVQEHQQLGQAGIHASYSVPVDVVPSPQDMQAFAAMVGDMDMIEPGNECDVAWCNGTGPIGVSQVVATMPTLAAAGKLIGVPVIAPAFVLSSSYPEAGNLDPMVSMNNLHIYYGGRMPEASGWGAGDAQGNSYGSLQWWLDQANIDTPNMPSVITESGYLTMATPTPYMIPESIEAAYTPRTLLTSFNAGIKRTFIYELMEEYTSGTYGLIRADGSEKPAFKAVTNLMGLLSDQGSSFTPGTLDYSLQGATPAVQHLLLQKRDGSFWLVLWLSASPWDAVNAVPTPVTPQTVTVHLNGNQFAKHIYGIDSTGAMQGTGLPAGSTDQDVVVNEYVQVLQIGTGPPVTVQ